MYIVHCIPKDIQAFQEKIPKKIFSKNADKTYHLLHLYQYIVILIDKKHSLLCSYCFCIFVMDYRLLFLWKETFLCRRFHPLPITPISCTVSPPKAIPRLRPRAGSQAARELPAAPPAVPAAHLPQRPCPRH